MNHGLDVPYFHNISIPDICDIASTSNIILVNGIFPIDFNRREFSIFLTLLLKPMEHKEA